MNGPGFSFFCSWSGGKDCSLALELTVETGAHPAALFTVLDEGGARSRSHGMTLASLQAQAEAMALPLVVRSASWKTYEDAFVDGLSELSGMGILDGVFGDMIVAAHPEWIAHRQWVERVCGGQGITPHLPLWKLGGHVALDGLLGHKIRAVIVMTSAAALDNSFLGRELDAACVADLEAAGCDPTGEGGEFHTAVFHAPQFARPLALETGNVTEHDGCRFLDVRLSLPSSDDASMPAGNLSCT